ncbi:MAG: tetratricopeptide repeat protein, partial [Chloroflexota bacterium]
MADIALRVYLEEIDGMIDGNRVDEAIAHLKHILGIYPKNLEAYRLLAKALLEKNRHLDAADVFQRVLSSVPDDFISHIGMAVVRE